MTRFARTVLLLLASAVAAAASAQDFDFNPPESATDDALPEALRDLAGRVLPAYQENDPDRYFSTLATLQIAVGDPAAAHTSRLTLRERLETEGSPLPPGREFVYDIYIQARAIEATETVPFEDAYARAFQETLTGIDDLQAYALEDYFSASLESLRDALQRALDQRRDAASITLEQALDVLRAWFAFEGYRSFGALVDPLLAQDNDRRYVSDAIAIPVGNGATIAADLVRPRAATAAGELPTLLEFTLDRSTRDAREAAAHGYVSVLARSRIADVQFRPRAPFESDGDDARAAIEWIARQSWSDGRVGMHGVGYGGFVAWSAAKRLPRALQAIATSDAMAPGIDMPSTNRIVRNEAYRWVYGLLAPPGDALRDDETRWRSLDDEWYRSGRIYRDFPALPGRARAIFRSWLNHPSYDRFWQKWLPFGAEFAAVDIPVLTVTGYYSAGETASLYYFTQHHQHNENAEHALLIGPFNEQSVAGAAASSVGGLDLDTAARIDATDARYAWLAHVLHGAERPAIVSATVNYQVAGTNEWRHAPSLAALESNALRYYLAAAPNGPPHELSAAKAAAPMAVTETLDLRDRDDGGWRPTRELILREIPARQGTLFMTEPFEEPIDVAGRFRGELDFTINKYDADLVMMLYELRPDGEFVKLFDPAFEFRASYARDRVNRRLLLAGIRQQLPFQSERMIGRRLEAGSRLVLALGINKRADQQVNYGGTGDVSEESIEGAGAPVRIRWHEGSFFEVFTAPAIASSSAAQARRQ